MKVQARGWAAIAVSVVSLLGVSGCDQGEHVASDVRFGKVSGGVSVASDDDATVNLVIVAPVGDPVWSEFHELIVVNDVAGGGDLVLGKGAVTVYPGTKRDGLQVGSIPLTIPSDMEEFDLTKVKAVIGEGANPTTYSVGDWHLDRRKSKSVFSIVGDYPASISECGEVEFELRLGRGANAAVTGVETDAPGLSISDVDVDVDDSGTGAIAFDLTCDEAYDVYAFSPTLIVEEEDGGTHAEPLDQILVGYLDMTEETVQQILAR